MIAVRGKRGKHSHVTLDARVTAGCNKKCDGWIVLDFKPQEHPGRITCDRCCEIAEGIN